MRTVPCQVATTRRLAIQLRISICDDAPRAATVGRPRLNSGGPRLWCGAVWARTLWVGRQRSLACPRARSVGRVLVAVLGRRPLVQAELELDLFGSQIQGDLIGVAQWRFYQGVAKEFGSAASDSFP